MKYHKQSYTWQQNQFNLIVWMPLSGWSRLIYQALKWWIKWRHAYVGFPSRLIMALIRFGGSGTPFSIYSWILHDYKWKWSSFILVPLLVRGWTPNSLCSWTTEQCRKNACFNYMNHSHGTILITCQDEVKCNGKKLRNLTDVTKEIIYRVKQ